MTFPTFWIDFFVTVKLLAETDTTPELCADGECRCSLIKIHSLDAQFWKVFALLLLSIMYIYLPTDVCQESSEFIGSELERWSRKIIPLFKMWFHSSVLCLRTETWYNLCHMTITLTLTLENIAFSSLLALLTANESSQCSSHSGTLMHRKACQNLFS